MCEGPAYFKFSRHCAIMPSCVRSLITRELATLQGRVDPGPSSACEAVWFITSCGLLTKGHLRLSLLPSPCQDSKALGPTQGLHQGNRKGYHDF